MAHEPIACLTHDALSVYDAVHDESVSVFVSLYRFTQTPKHDGTTIPDTTSYYWYTTVSSREAVAMAQREGEAGDGDAPDADGLVPVPKNEPRSPQVRATSTRHRASRGVPRSVVPVSSITRISQSLVASTTERAGPLTSTTPARLARRPRWCPVSSPRAHPRAPRPPRSRRPPRARRVSLRTAPEASAW